MLSTEEGNTGKESSLEKIMSKSESQLVLLESCIVLASQMNFLSYMDFFF